VGWLDDDRFRNVAGRRGERTARGETASVNLDLYAEDRWQLRPGLALVAGLQLSRAVRDFDDRFLADGDQTDRQEFTGSSPKLGLIVDLPAGASAFANVGRSFEPPSFGELVNLGGGGLLRLDAQTATSLEAGTRGRRRWLSWDLVLYHARLDGELLALNDAAGNPLGTINAGRTLHAGAEAGLEVRGGGALAGLVLRQVYNWSRFRFAGDAAFGDNRLAGAPEHFLRAELLYEAESGLYGGPGVEWVPDAYPVDHANTLYAEGYAVLGAKLGYRLERGLAWFVEVKNLTGETYAATTGVIADARGQDAAQFLPGDGASAFVGLEYRW
jgi:iron complex outermembrane receptor protein